jgi:phosphoribosylglycinamide formyltransferase-1
LSPEPLPEGSRFAVLASGSGTNLQALLDSYPRELVVVAGDREGAFAFERAFQIRAGEVRLN